MKNIAHLAVYLVMVFSSNHGLAQTKLSELPGRKFIWDLGPTTKEEFLQKDCGLVIMATDTLVWKKTHDSVEVAIVVPSDLGFIDGFKSSDFINKALSTGLALAPEWLPVQMYTKILYEEEAIWVPTGRTSHRGEIVRLGRNSKTQSKAFTNTSKNMDLYLDDPRTARANSVWLFIKKP